jgi:hypothetical protein
LPLANTAQELTTPEGRTYYHDSTTGSTMWEAPAEFSNLQVAMQAVSDAASKQAEDAVTTVDAPMITTMVAALSSHMNNSSIAQSAAQTLSTLSMNEANADAIAQVRII